MHTLLGHGGVMGSQQGTYLVYGGVYTSVYDAAHVLAANSTAPSHSFGVELIAVIEAQHQWSGWVAYYVPYVPQYTRENAIEFGDPRFTGRDERHVAFPSDIRVPDFILPPLLLNTPVWYTTGINVHDLFVRADQPLVFAEMGGTAVLYDMTRHNGSRGSRWVDMFYDEPTSE